ncbi:uncharacterized protein DUF4190 [Labedella gwakjiensis]|nr:DUF4190 domain-containing protein [Labedella gwakjiensis]PSL36700.1 uncharacterized protein DUF4190 [Labedella gwakjiensis]
MTNSEGGAPNGSIPQQGGYPQQPGGYPSAPGGQQAYGGAQQPYGGAQQPYAAYGSPYPPARPTNTLAIVTIIAAFVVPLVGIVTGHIALNQLKTSGEQGEGLAKAGLIISYVYSGIVVLILLISIVAPFLFLAAFLPALDSIPTSP